MTVHDRNRALRVAAGILLFTFPAARPAYGSLNAGSYLKSGIGARALGMGGSFVAVADDATAIYWNPAGLSPEGPTQFFVSYADRFGLGIEDQNIGASIPWGKKLRVGFAAIRSSLNDIKRSTDRDDDGRPIIDGSFGNTELALYFSVGIRIHKLLSVGFTGKYFSHELAGKTADGMGIDLAWMLRPVTGLTIGFNAQNFNRPRMNWNTGNGHFDRIPANFKLGAAYQTFGSRIRLSMDLDFPDYDPVRLNTGVEYQMVNQFFVRGGLTADQVSFGGSFRTQGVRVDYAFRPHSLGATHRFSLFFGF